MATSTALPAPSSTPNTMGVAAPSRPPSRPTGINRFAVTEKFSRVLAPRRAAPSGGPRKPPPRGPARAGGSRLPPPPRQLAPKDTRWWAGAAILTVSLLLLGFVSHVALFSVFQHHRAQDLSYQQLRTTLAKAETPVGQLDLDAELVTIGTPVALIQIGATKLTEVVVEGSTGEALRAGAGHRRDSVMPGQAGTSVILGRQTAYGGPFGSLNELKPGDEIAVTTGQGVHSYTVFALRRAGDPMPAPLAQGKGRLELMTADGLALFPSGVLHIDAELTSPVQTTPTKVLAYPALPPIERAMGQDQSRLFSSFFMLVIFAAAGITLWWLWTRWGKWQAWLIGVPIMLALGVTTADTIMNALPNLL
ncbi:sortase [Cryobacterium sp. TMT1-3]|uniref:Sortase n=1 Tax=Cryobacterium luteum TaxID=1424661 RepID=A0A1H8CCG2_9MICO|nr:sortase [Cryobacterium luteum]TFC27362.1 sortase [Cryobacterium sp. TMT1-3]SEM92652.1 LPXTG-site transpeptidase (sortase) family protein [Cryobacterium luteum]